MAVFDQAQSPRLGQRGDSPTTQVLMFTGDNIPEAPWYGMMIYRPDLQVLQVYNGEAFEDVVGGQAGIYTFVGPDVPISQAIGDLWFDTDDNRRLYRAAKVGADEIAPGEWESFRDQAIQQAYDLAQEANTTAQAVQDKFPIIQADIAPGAIGTAQIQDFSLAVRKFNTLTHIIA